MEHESQHPTRSRTRVARLIGLLAAALVVSACDRPAELVGEFRQGEFAPQPAGGRGRLTRHDNPLVTGTHFAFEEQWSYAQTVVPGRPETSAQQARAFHPGSVLRIRASAPVFAGDIVRKPEFQMAAGGRGIPYETQFETTTVPWVAFPQQCTSLADAACARFQQRPAPNQSQPFSFPYFIGDISLARREPVRLTATLVDSNGNTTRNEGTAVIQRDPGVRYVPVRVNIFVDPAGNMGHRFMGGDASTDAGRREIVRRVRRVFDDYAVDVLGLARERNTVIEQAVQLTRDPMAENEGSSSMDSLFAQCGVQFSLQGVTFIVQDDGLERAEIVYGNANGNLPFSLPSDPVAARSAERMTDFILGVPPGSAVNVWVVGSINPGTFRGFDTAGIGFDAVPGAGYAMIAGREAGSEAAAANLLKHEVGHVMGLEHSENGSPDGIRALFARNLSASMCSRAFGEAREAVPLSNP